MGDGSYTRPLRHTNQNKHQVSETTTAAQKRYLFPFAEALQKMSDTDHTQLQTSGNGFGAGEIFFRRASTMLSAS